MASQSRPNLKILHTADLHLGDDLYDRSVVRGALKGIVETAVSEAVDAVIIAGDLFDRSRPSADDVDFVLEQLALLPVPTVLLPGNHDPLEENSVYYRVDFAGQCSNLRLLRQHAGEMVNFADMRLTVWGRPTVDHNPDFRPIAEVPLRQQDHWHIGVAHGLYVPAGQETERSSLIRSGEIAATGWDYIALGHVHTFLDVSEGTVVACYPGTPVLAHSFPEGTGCVAIVHLDRELGVSARRVLIG